MPKISELDTLTSVTSDDFVVVVNDPGGAPSTNKITVSNFANTVAQFVPYASNVASGTIKVGENLSVNTSGFLNNSTANLPTTGRSEGFVVTWDAVTNAAIWQAFSGVHDYTLVTSSPYTVVEHDDIIFADCNTNNGNITIILPDTSSAVPPSLGKAYTIKNIYPAGFKVTVATASGISSGSNILENPVTGNFVVNFDITQKGDVQDFIWDGTVWRHLGSQTLPIFYTSTDTYAQVAIKNASAGQNASADLAIYNNQGDEVAGTGPFVDVGISSNTYSNSTVYEIYGPSDSYVYNDGGKLIVGTSSVGTNIVFHTGGTMLTHTRLTISNTSITANTGTLFASPMTTKASNANGTAGQICWDTNNIYICVGTNSWKKAALTTY